ncbi:hypothetical protein DEO72_LG10g2152 [Vigna unguiculata]|uniref:Uncharacterized protein n=1 Tax=Vigna unguiculata TaxID=3917 RepID=A0A4D6NED1_VIGUN|nr:hypothetical protein DEO72_LG10g2152 [Vigna unguiculata]
MICTPRLFIKYIYILTNQDVDIRYAKKSDVDIWFVKKTYASWPLHRMSRFNVDEVHGSHLMNRMSTSDSYTY